MLNDFALRCETARALRPALRCTGNNHNNKKQMTLLIVCMAMSFIIGLVLGIIIQSDNGPDYNDEE
jgi:ABC-type proline/glycine betaine transport system permease subunit